MTINVISRTDTTAQVTVKVGRSRPVTRHLKLIGDKWRGWNYQGRKIISYGATL